MSEAAKLGIVVWGNLVAVEHVSPESGERSWMLAIDHNVGENGHVAHSGTTPPFAWKCRRP